MGFLCQKQIVGCSSTHTRNNQYWGRSLRALMLLKGNSILLFLIKLLKNLENQAYISLLLELISNWIDLRIQKTEAMAINAFSLTWNNKDFYMLATPFSLVGWILVMIYRDKANAATVVTRLCNPYWCTCSCYWWPTTTCCTFGCH